jgi:hypothetical protein
MVDATPVESFAKVLERIIHCKVAVTLAYSYGTILLEDGFESFDLHYSLPSPANRRPD